MYSILDPLTYGLLFVFDCEQGESASKRIQWTDKPVEDGTNFPRYGVIQSRTYNIEGLVTATPLDGTGFSATRTGDAYQALEDLANKRQEVMALMGNFAGRVVIENVSARQGAGDPEQLNISVSLKEIRTVTAKATAIPPSRMRRRVKRRASATKGFAGATGKEIRGAAEIPKNKTMAIKIGQFIGG
jgi:hypothetical protein